MALLFLVLFTWQCSTTGDSSSDEATSDAYIKVDSTFVGIQTIATGLNEPWEITWGPDDWIWLTEHGGTVSKINPKNGKKIVLLKLDDVFEGTTPGLLGMAVHPDQKKYPYVFLLYDSKNNDKDIVLNVVRYTVDGNTLRERKKIFEMPAAEGHAGSRIKISSNNKLFIANGDAEREMTKKNAQNVQSLVGKILRLNLDGSIPDDNPFTDSPVWSWGYRNQEGLTFGKDNMLYTSEHGPATDDEVNIIEKGRNYGWPRVNGYCDKADEKAFCSDSLVKEPLKAWTPTIAPAGIAYYPSAKIPEWQNSLILTTLKNASLHVLALNAAGTAIKGEQVYLQKKYGRLRDVCISPAGDIYVSTSNRDWNPPNGFPKPNDDRILRLSKIENANGIPLLSEIEADSAQINQNLSKGATIYENYCASCHKADGKGVKGNFPPLAKNKMVTGNRKDLISLVLNGTSEPMEVNGVSYQGEMPSFNFLNDKEVAQLLTFIRSNFGNEAPKVSEVLVNRVRGKESQGEE